MKKIPAYVWATKKQSNADIDAGGNGGVALKVDVEITHKQGYSHLDHLFESDFLPVLQDKIEGKFFKSAKEIKNLEFDCEVGVDIEIHGLDKEDWAFIGWDNVPEWAEDQWRENVANDKKYA
jgi:hypothetical protein